MNIGGFEAFVVVFLVLRPLPLVDGEDGAARL